MIRYMASRYLAKSRFFLSTDGNCLKYTPTDLAREIAEHVHDAYKGSLEFHYNKDENLLRAAWHD